MGQPRDYYADLELPATADIPEIKKQFRKLALKYHPDRNPGREEEVNSKFQMIQSAHEILTDPTAKAKYDASRRGGRFGAASGVKGNPWAGAAENFPPPPRRSAAPKNRTSGAQRWSSRFAPGVPPTAKQYNSADPETKKNAARAFENMRKAQSSAKKPGQANPSQPPPMPPRSNTARQRAEASFGTRKTSAQSRPPMPPDEPQATNNRYSQQRPESPRKARQDPIADPLRQFRDADQYADQRQSAPYATPGGEKTNPFSGTPGRAKSARETGRRDESSDYGHEFGDNSSNRQRSSSVPRHDRDDGGNLNVPQSEQRPTSAGNNQGEFSKSSFKSRADSSHTTTDTDGPSIFNFEVNDETFVRTSPDHAKLGKTSLDDINTQFGRSDEAGAWKFSAGSGTQSPDIQGSPSKPPTAQPDESQDPENQFNANGWSNKFGPQTFAPQQGTTASASPTRASRANSKKAKGKTAGSAIVIDDSSDDDLYEWSGRKSSKDGNVDSPQAMDIDSPPVGGPDGLSQTGTARNIPVEPSRPEWRPGSGEAGAETVKPNVPAGEPKSNAVGSEDSEEFRASFADLKNVAPFSQQQAGLKSFLDLKDNLPFESQASPDSPVKLPKPQPLVFPPPPEAPRLPPTVAVEGIKPNTASWAKYLSDFQSYLREWEGFNGKVVDHFAARNARVNELRRDKGYDFLAARSEAEVQEYYSWVQQDNDVRRRWNAACEGHEERFREFMAFREKMK